MEICLHKIVIGYFYLPKKSKFNIQLKFKSLQFFLSLSLSTQSRPNFQLVCKQSRKIFNSCCCWIVLKEEQEERHCNGPPSIHSKIDKKVCCSISKILSFCFKCLHGNSQLCFGVVVVLSFALHNAFSCYWQKDVSDTGNRTLQMPKKVTYEAVLIKVATLC